MNMEVDGAEEQPMGLSLKSEPDSNDNVANEKEPETDTKINGTNTITSNIHEEVDLDTLKIELDSPEGSDSEDELKGTELKDALEQLQNFNTQIIKTESNVTESAIDIANTESLKPIVDLEDINDEYDENSKDHLNHDDHVSNVDNSEVINISTSSQDDSNTVNDNIDDELIDDSENCENYNESNENSNSGVKDTTGVDNEKTNNNAKVQIKPVEKMQLRRSSRGIKRKRYDDEESDIEERKALPLIKNQKSPNKPIVPKHIVNHIANIPNLYQKVLGPNTTLTPISVKNKNMTVKPAQSVSQPAILPSLTDDMFVVEAPSFIVPYVYEKPPIQPLKQYVEKMQKEIAEEKLRKEEEKKENEKVKSEQLDNEKKEENEETDKEISKENGDDLSSSDVETKEDEKDKKEVSEKERRKDIEEDESWDGYSSDSKDDDSDKEVESNIANKSKKLDYFDLTLGKFFSKIGLNLVKKFVQNDLLKQQNRKLSKEKRAGQITTETQTSIISLKKNIAVSDKKCAPFTFEQHKCKVCGFKTESRLALSHHLETPHMKNNMYRCTICKFEVKGPHDILFHMQSEHSIRAKLEVPLAYHQCPNCPFEDNGKGKLARHQIACAKRFKPNLNLSPPFEWEPPAKILTARAKAPIMNPYQYNFTRAPNINQIGKAIINNILPANSFRPRLRTPIVMPRANSVQGISILRGGATIRPSIPSSAFIQNNFPSGSKTKISNHPSISITPLPRQVQPQRQNLPANKDGCVICEICDGYIKDLEQLRSHMQWIHRVKIHPKMMTNSPPLNCQKCQLRFFTDQGLERHLLGSHGLVTKSMQEEANKGNDGGRCPICGRVYQWKLLDHVGKDHKMNLKPAHLSYKCTVCSAIFGLYKQFENHVYSAHSVVAKRVMNKGKSLPQSNNSKIGNSILKPLRNREDLTITPSSGRTLSSDED